MGNNQSISCVVDRQQTDLSSYLTPKQIKLVQDSWDEIKDDLPTLGLTIFMRFFETEPDMKSLFPKIVRMNEANKLEWDMDREMLQKHAVTVLEGLGAAVESLEEADFLNSVLISIGQTHVKRSVKPQMLKRLWPSLHHGLGVALEDKYTKEVSEAWRKVYIYICLQMKRGMENPDRDFNEDIFFETEPDMKSLFPKIVRMNEANKLEWYMDREMLQKHAVEGHGAAVESLEEADFLNSVLISIGQTHVKRSVKPQMLKRLWPSLHHGLGVVLEDKYTKEVSEAWRKVYIYICLQMKRGMENPDRDFNEDMSVS